MRNTKKYLRKKRFGKTKLRKRTFRRRYTRKKGGDILHSIQKKLGLSRTADLAALQKADAERQAERQQQQKETQLKQAGERCLNEYPDFLPVALRELPRRVLPPPIAGLGDGRLRPLSESSSSSEESSDKPRLRAAARRRVSPHRSPSRN